MGRVLIRLELDGHAFGDDALVDLPDRVLRGPRVGAAVAGFESG